MDLYRTMRSRGAAVPEEYANLVLDNGSLLRDQVMHGIDDAVRFDINNIARFVETGHAPNLREMQGVISPWSHAWFEFRSDDGEPLAALVLVDARDRDEMDQIRELFAVHPEWVARGKDAVPEDGFVHVAYPFAMLGGRPFLLGWFHWFAHRNGDPVLSAEGRFVNLAQILHEEARGIVGYIARVVALACCFANCRNVETIAVLPSRQQRRAAERKGEPVHSHYVLAIDGATQRKVYPKGLPVPSNKRLHICRGHFATYTPEAPLFGKLTGRFWVPAHVRGTSDAGTLHKDYRIAEVTA